MKIVFTLALLSLVIVSGCVSSDLDISFEGNEKYSSKITGQNTSHVKVQIQVNETPRTLVVFEPLDKESKITYRCWSDYNGYDEVFEGDVSYIFRIGDNKIIEKGNIAYVIPSFGSDLRHENQIIEDFPDGHHQFDCYARYNSFFSKTTYIDSIIVSETNTNFYRQWYFEILSEGDEYEFEFMSWESEQLFYYTGYINEILEEGLV